LEKKRRYSHQRERIYEYLAANTAHPTAEMIYNDLREEIQGLSLGTIYRNLKLLEELGKVRKVTTYQGNERYDAICHDHVHFICESCGAIVDMPGVDSDQILANIELEEGYQSSKLDMIITGGCPNCAKELKQKQI